MKYLLTLASVLWLLPVVAVSATTMQSVDQKYKTETQNACAKIGRKLSSVSVNECNALSFDVPRFYSVGGLPILEKHFPATRADAPRILFIGGIHGDEYSSVSVTFKWLSTLNKHHSGAYDWHFLPLANPDGLLQSRSSRVNQNKVDLNRNFISAPDFPEPLVHWKKKARERSRYYPGQAPLSEPESRVIHQLIDEYHPDIVVSVHAPHGILDFDGSNLQPPKKLGPLHLRQLGTYPGSLGNYAWFVKRIPVMTIELEHAGIMPANPDIERMWADLVSWVGDKTVVRKQMVLSESE